MARQDVSVGFKAHLGWLAVVAVKQRTAQPRPVAALRLDLFRDQPREIQEPYHVAGGWEELTQSAPHPDAEALILKARARQDVLAAVQLEEFSKAFAEQGLRWTGAVLLVGRGIVHSLQESLASHAHIHIAEGDAVRDATRHALRAIGMPYVEQDEKNTLATAAAELGLSVEGLDAQLKALKPDTAKSWTKEHRTIAAAAWLASAAR